MGPGAHWRAALAEGRFLLQRDVVTGQAFFPPRAFAPGTGHDADWFEASGVGEVYSLTHIMRKPPEPPYTVALITLAEGPRLMNRVDSAEEVHIGMKVRARIITEDGQPLLVFVPA